MNKKKKVAIGAALAGVAATLPKVMTNLHKHAAAKDLSHWNPLGMYQNAEKAMDWNRYSILPDKEVQASSDFIDGIRKIAKAVVNN